MSYRNPWIQEKITQLREDVASIKANPNFIRLGTSNPHTLDEEVGWQESRIDLLAASDKLSHKALSEKVTSMLADLDPEYYPILNVGPYPQDEKTFRLICSIEMLTAALTVHPKPNKKKG